MKNREMSHFFLDWLIFIAETNTFLNYFDGCQMMIRFCQNAAIHFYSVKNFLGREASHLS